MPSSSVDYINTVSTFFALEDGMNGFPSVLHGGIVSTLIDEAMGVLLSVNAEVEQARKVATGQDTGEAVEGVGAFTAQLNIKFVDKVVTPGVVLVKAEVTRREGRKIWMRASVARKNGLQEDLEGTLVECAVGEALFVKPRNEKL